MARQPSSVAVDKFLLKEQARLEREQQARLLQAQQPKEKPLFGPPIQVRRKNDPTHDKVSGILGSYDRAKELVASHSMIGAILQPQTPRPVAPAAKHFPLLTSGHCQPLEDLYRPISPSSDWPVAADSDSETCGESDERKCSRQGVFDQFNSSDCGAKSLTSPQAAVHQSPEKHRPTNCSLKQRTSSADEHGKQRTERHSSDTTTNNKQQQLNGRPTHSSSNKHRTIMSPTVNLDMQPGAPPRCNNVQSVVNCSGDRDSRTAVVDSRTVHVGLGGHSGVSSSKHSQQPTDNRHNKRLKLAIPSPKGHEQFEEFIADLLKEVSVPPPLTAILTPNNSDSPSTSNVFPFHSSPPVKCVSTTTDNKQCLSQSAATTTTTRRVSASQHSPTSHRSPVHNDLLLSSSDDDDDPDVHVVRGVSSPVHHQQQQQQREEEEVGLQEEEHVPQVKADTQQLMTSAAAATSSVTSSSLSITNRHVNAVRDHPSTASSSSESESSSESDDESDSNQSSSDDEHNNVNNKTSTKTRHHLTADEDRDQQTKRPSWEMKNFVPKEKPLVPLPMWSVESAVATGPVDRLRPTAAVSDVNDVLDRLCPDLFDDQPPLSPLKSVLTDDVDILGMSHDIDDVFDSVINQHDLPPVGELTDLVSPPSLGSSSGSVTWSVPSTTAMQSPPHSTPVSSKPATLTTSTVSTSYLVQPTSMLSPSNRMSTKPLPSATPTLPAVAAKKPTSKRTASSSHSKTPVISVSNNTKVAVNMPPVVTSVKSTGFSNGSVTSAKTAPKPINCVAPMKSSPIVSPSRCKVLKPMVAMDTLLEPSCSVNTGRQSTGSTTKPSSSSLLSRPSTDVIKPSASTKSHRSSTEKVAPVIDASKSASLSRPSKLVDVPPTNVNRPSIPPVDVNRSSSTVETRPVGIVGSLNHSTDTNRPVCPVASSSKHRPPAAGLSYVDGRPAVVVSLRRLPSHTYQSAEHLAASVRSNTARQRLSTDTSNKQSIASKSSVVVMATGAEPAVPKTVLCNGQQKEIVNCVAGRSKSTDRTKSTETSVAVDATERHKDLKNVKASKRKSKDSLDVAATDSKRFCAGIGSESNDSSYEQQQQQQQQVDTRTAKDLSAQKKLSVAGAVSEFKVSSSSGSKVASTELKQPGRTSQPAAAAAAAAVQQQTAVPPAAATMVTVTHGNPSQSRDATTPVKSTDDRNIPTTTSHLQKQLHSSQSTTLPTTTTPSTGKSTAQPDVGKKAASPSSSGSKESKDVKPVVSSTNNKNIKVERRSSANETIVVVNKEQSVKLEPSSGDCATNTSAVRNGFCAVVESATVAADSTDNIDNQSDVTKPLDRRKPAATVDEKIMPSRHYFDVGRKLKHEGDVASGKFVRMVTYMESVMKFVQHGDALERESADCSQIHKLWTDTLKFCQSVCDQRFLVDSPSASELLVISLRLQALICLRLFCLKKAEAQNLRRAIHENFQNPNVRPLQVPSPYNGHGSVPAAGINGTLSPLSPHLIPSPAGSVSSVGSVGSQTNEHGLPRPVPTNGHTKLVAIPQRIHSLVLNYVNYMSHLQDCHEYWDKADSILRTSPDVMQFFGSLDNKFGALHVHSHIPLVACYVTDALQQLRQHAT